MSVEWGDSVPPLEASPPVGSFSVDQAERPGNSNSIEELGGGTWGSHPSRVSDAKDQTWVSEIRREPRRSCIVSAASERNEYPQHVHIDAQKKETESKFGTGSSMNTHEWLQHRWSQACSYVRSASSRSHRFTSSRDSVMASIPTFDIREPTTPEIARQMRRIYQLEEPVDENVWSYLNSIPRVVGISLCLIALWTMWFTSFVVAFEHVYPLCQWLLYFDTFLDLLYLVGVGMEFNISVVDRERRTEIQHRGTIIEIRLYSATFYFDVISCIITPFMLNEKLSRLQPCSSKLTTNKRLTDDSLLLSPYRSQRRQIYGVLRDSSSAPGTELFGITVNPLK